MRVLFINPVGTLGGAERVLLDSLVALRRRRPEWAVGVLLMDRGPLETWVRDTGATVRVVELPEGLRTLGEKTVSNEPKRIFVESPRLFLALGTFLRSARAVVNDFKPDIVHTNGFKAHLVAALLAGGTASVLHAHDFLSGRPVSRQLIRLARRRRLHIVANSRAVAAEYRNAVPRTRVHMLHNAVDETEFRPGPGDASGLAELAGLKRGSADAVVFGMVGTYARWKGHPCFLEAAAKVAAVLGQDNARFYIVGGPQYATRGSQFSESELRSRIDALGLGGVAGLVPFQPRVAEVHRALDVLVHPSTEPEPFGKSIVEGMASGRAVIVARAGGSVELFEEGVSALGFRPRDATDLADKMLLVAHDAELRRRLGAAARAHAERHFGISRFADGLCAIYDELLEAGR